MVEPCEWLSDGDREALAGACVAIGVFDGVHEGHRFLIEAMRAEGAERGLPTAIVTFNRDPDEVLGRPGFRKLQSDERRLEALHGLHCDRVVVVPFTKTLAALSPAAFLDGLLGAGAPSSIHVGEGFRFGARCAGDTETLRRWAFQRGGAVTVHPLLSMDGRTVSATAIRGLLAEGRVEEAAVLLGRPYRLEGTVEHGRAEGQAMGIRTANLIVPEPLLALGDGVYGAYAIVGQDTYKAAVSVGIAPTFPEARANVEAHLLDFDGDLYDQTIAMDFIAWLREMRVFSSTEELVTTIGNNIQWVRENL